MDPEAQAHSKAIRRHMKALAARCAERGLGVIDSEVKLYALEREVTAWLADRGADLGPIERALCLGELLLGDGRTGRTLTVGGGLSEHHKTRWLLGLLSAPGVLDLRPMPDDGWPPPLHFRVTALTTADADLLYGHFTGLFEAFLHLHFAAVASQFLWMAAERRDAPPDPLTRYGLKIVHAALTDSACQGGRIWLQRAAGLSCAGQALLAAGATVPCPELFGLLDPAGIDPKLDFDPNPAKTQQPVGALSPRAEAIDLARLIRNKDYGHTDTPTEPLPPDLVQGALRLADLFGLVFGAYRGYGLAHVGVVPGRGCIVQGIWNAAGNYLGRNNPANQWSLERIWDPRQDGELPAPTPPGLIDHWDGSLLLYRKDAPRARSLYLMPFAYRYENRTTETPVPALTDSVRWDRARGSTEARVHSIHQKAYRDLSDAVATAQGTWASETATGPVTGSRPAPEAIREIVAFIRQHCGLDLPTPVEALPPLRMRFDLDHLPEARKAADEAIPRDDEVARILDLARAAPERRLLLTGPSGGGKSVLLAQIARSLETRGEGLVYFTMDQAPDGDTEPAPPGLATGRSPRLFAIGTAGLPGLADGPELVPMSMDLGAGASSKTLAVPVRMHLLANLARICGRADALPADKLGEEDVRRRVRALLDLLPEDETVWVLIDALNQCPAEPAALLAGLPRPLPERLRVIAATQPVEPVIRAVDDGGRNPWAQAPLAAVRDDLAQALILFEWPQSDREALAEQSPDAAGQGLPPALVADLRDQAVGLPLLLREWGHELHERWLAAARGPAVFDDFRRVLAARDHRSMPHSYRERLDQARRGFDPADLPDALLWTFAILERPLDLARLQRAALVLVPQFPRLRAVSADDVRTALGLLGGFLVVSGSHLDPRWRLYHPRIGDWFKSLHGTPERLFAVREALVPLGAGPDLDDPESLAAWAQRVLDWEPEVDDLSAVERMALLERLIDGLPDASRPVSMLSRFRHRRAGLLALRAGETQKTGDSKLAVRQSQEALSVAVVLLARCSAEQKADVQYDLAAAWGARGFALWHGGKKRQCLEAYRHTVELREDIKAQYPKAWNAGKQRALASAYRSRGVATANLRRNDDALDDCRRAIDLVGSLDIGRPEVRTLAAEAYYTRGWVLHRRKRYQEAIRDHSCGIELRDGLDQRETDVRAALGDCYTSRGNSRYSLKQYRGAIGDYNRAIDLLDGLDIHKTGVREKLSNAHWSRANVFDDIGRLSAADVDLDRAIALSPGLSKKLLGSLWRLWRPDRLMRPSKRYTGTLPTETRIDWQPLPLIGSHWHALTGEAARPHLDVLASLLAPSKYDRFSCWAANASALRARPLACYPDSMLCELRLDMDGVPGALAFLSGLDGPLLVIGKSDPVHAFNKSVDLRLSDNEAFIDYLLLFCSAVRAEDGRFQILECPESVPWRAGTDGSQKNAEIAERIQAPRILSVDDTAAMATACCLYSGEIYEADFKIFRSGMVEMTSDRSISKNAVGIFESFDGPLRLSRKDPSDESGTGWHRQFRSMFCRIVRLLSRGSMVILKVALPFVVILFLFSLFSIFVLLLRIASGGLSWLRQRIGDWAPLSPWRQPRRTPVKSEDHDKPTG